MNEPVMAIEAKFFRSNYINQVVVSVQLYYKVSSIHMLKLIYSFGHVFTVNSHCHGRCFVKKTYTTVYFLQFRTHLEANLAGSLQNVFDKCLRV